MLALSPKFGVKQSMPIGSARSRPFFQVERALPIVFLSESFFGLKNASNWFVCRSTKNDCCGCKLSSTIDCSRGVRSRYPGSVLEACILIAFSVKGCFRVFLRPIYSLGIV